MADSNSAAPAVNTPIEPGHFDEKKSEKPVPSGDPEKKAKAEDEEEEDDEDIDALIQDLESQDGHIDEEDEEGEPGMGRTVPEELLQTDTRLGLTEADVLARRRKYGLNQMKEEKENLFLKFLMYFVGPIQFVMEVSRPASENRPYPRSARFQKTLIEIRSPNRGLAVSCGQFSCSGQFDGGAPHTSFAGRPEESGSRRSRRSRVDRRSGPSMGQSGELCKKFLTRNGR